MAASVKSLVLLALGVCLGLTLIVLGSALYNNWWPIFSVAFYVAAPLPFAFCRSEDSFSGPSPLTSFGYFLSAFFVVGGIALPSVLLHSATILYQTMLFDLSGGLVLVLSISLYMRFSTSSDAGVPYM